MNTDNKTVREKAEQWYEDLTMWERQSILVKNNFTGTVTAEVKERMYIAEHTEPTPKEQTKGVIERGDEALQVLIKELEKSDVRKHTCINQIGYSQLERDIVTALFAHYHDTHYMPLLELCGELVEQVTEGLGYTLALSTHLDDAEKEKMAFDAAMKMRVILEKANNYLKQ